MRVIERGHIYELDNKTKGVQRLEFFKDLPEDDPGHDGVLCQEVLRALIDRVIDLNIQKPCHENVEIVNGLREMLLLFEQRAFRGTVSKSYSKCGLHVEQLPVRHNGHLFSLGKEETNE